MIVFKTLTLRNFLSFGASPTVVKLDKQGTTLIVGKDLDNTVNGDGANGVGKTTILNALCYALYDKTISDISKDNLVNDINKKQMEVTLEFENNGVLYFINRQRKMKAGASGNNVYLYKDGDDVTLDSMANTNGEIERIIGMPFDLFVRIAAFSANSTPFLDLPSRSATAANQTDIIEGLFGLKMLSERADMLKAQTKDSETSYKMLVAQAEQLEKEKQRHEEQIASAKRRMVAWEKSHKEEIKDLKQQIKEVDAVDIEKERELIEQAELMESVISEAASRIREHKRDIKEATAIIKSNEAEIASLEESKCPYCEQEFHDTQSKLKACKKAVAGATEILAEAEAGLKIETELTETNNETLAVIEKKQTVTSERQLSKIETQRTSLREHLEKEEKQENPHFEQYEELLEVNFDDDVDMKQVTELETLIAHQKFLYKLLTKKDSFVRKTLLNKNIPFLNRRLHHYLSELGLPHTVEFTHELSARITQFGREKDFGNLSNGQRARVNLALSLSFRDVLQNLHDHINFCMFDEVLDVGLDALGVQAAAKMLKHKAREEQLCLFIISHRDEVENAFDRIMTVEMSKGFSYINEETKQ